MKWIPILVVLAFTACGAFNKAIWDKSNKSPFEFQPQVVDAKGPTGEDCVTVVTFKTIAGKKLKLFEKCPIETKKKHFYVTIYPRGGSVEAVKLTSKVKITLINSMKQYAASTLHVDTSRAINLQRECDYAQFGSLRHALLIMLIDMQAEM